MLFTIQANHTRLHKQAMPFHQSIIRTRLAGKKVSLSFALSIGMLTNLDFFAT